MVARSQQVRNLSCGERAHTRVSVRAHAAPSSRRPDVMSDTAHPIVDGSATSQITKSVTGRRGGGVGGLSVIIGYDGAQAVLSVAI